MSMLMPSPKRERRAKAEVPFRGVGEVIGEGVTVFGMAAEGRGGSCGERACPGMPPAGAPAKTTGARRVEFILSGRFGEEGDRKMSDLRDDRNDDGIPAENVAEEAAQAGTDTIGQTGNVVGIGGFELIEHEAFGVFEQMVVLLFENKAS